MTNVNKDALVSAIANKTEQSKKDIEMVIDTMVEEITKSLQAGNKVTLTGFGTFRISARAARMGINPQTKASIHPCYESAEIHCWKSIEGSCEIDQFK